MTDKTCDICHDEQRNIVTTLGDKDFCDGCTKAYKLGYSTGYTQGEKDNQLTGVKS